MARPAALAILLTIAAMPAMAQTRWTSGNTFLIGGNTGGCNLHLLQVTHDGGPQSPIIVTLQNRNPRMAIFTGRAELAGNGQSRSGPLGYYSSVTIHGGQQHNVNTVRPFGGSLAGTRVTVTITGCEQR